MANQPCDAPLICGLVFLWCISPPFVARPLLTSSLSFTVACLQLVLSAKQDLVEEAAALVEKSATKGKPAAKKAGASGARKPKRKDPGSEDDVSEDKENSRKKVKASKKDAKGKGKVSKDVGSDEEEEDEDEEDDEEGSEADSEGSDAPKKRGAKGTKKGGFS
jgi:hypothetical protein